MNTSSSNNNYLRLLANDIILDRYKVVEEIGPGALGIVYRCIDISDNVPVAVKFLRLDVSHNINLMDGLISCIDQLLSLNHPNIASLYSVDRDSTTGDYFVVSELVDGCSLSEWRKLRQLENKPPTLDEILILIRYVASALDYAHSQNIYHGHLSPENIRITPDGKVKVLDFSFFIATRLADNQNQIGSSLYVSPDCLTGIAPSSSSDQYSLATIVYELFSGELPFAALDLKEFFSAVLYENPTLIEFMPEHMNASLIKALHKDPFMRFPSCLDFVKSLGTIDTANSDLDITLSRTQTFADDSLGSIESLPVAPSRYKSKKVIYLAGISTFSLFIIVGAILSFKSIESKRIAQESLAQKIRLLLSDADSALETEHLPFVLSTVVELTKLDAPLEAKTLQNKYALKLFELEMRKSCATASSLRDKILPLSHVKDFPGNIEALELLFKEGEIARQEKAWKSALILYTNYVAVATDIFEKLRVASELNLVSIYKSAEHAIITRNFPLVDECITKLKALSPDDKRTKDILLLYDFEKLADEGNRTSDFSNVYPVALEVLSARPEHARAMVCVGICYDKGQVVAQDKLKAIKWYRKAAEAGSASAQNNLGACYYRGEGVETNYTDAVFWYFKAAKQGYEDAQVNLGLCYARGTGVTKDAVEAFAWYLKSAEKGYDYAQFLVSDCYFKGSGVSKSDTEAFKWLRKSAEQGNKVAQSSLGCCYLNAVGVPKNYSDAVMWFQKSAEQGDEVGQNNLGYCYQNGVGVPIANNEAVKWYRKSAEQGYAIAQINLASCYYEGVGVAKNDVAAFGWVHKAATSGDPEAQFKLANCYKLGIGVLRDNYAAYSWFLKSAEQGYISALNELALCYVSGFGIPKDYSKAFFLFKKAADQGDLEAQNNLGYCYEEGYGVAIDFREAVICYLKAANKGYPKAQTNLGYCYRKGKGVAMDYRESVMWFQKAADQGNVNAQFAMGQCYSTGCGVIQNDTEAINWYKKAAEQGHSKSLIIIEEFEKRRIEAEAQSNQQIALRKEKEQLRKDRREKEIQAMMNDQAQMIYEQEDMARELKSIKFRMNNPIIHYKQY